MIVAEGNRVPCSALTQLRFSLRKRYRTAFLGSGSRSQEAGGMDIREQNFEKVSDTARIRHKDEAAGIGAEARMNMARLHRRTAVMAEDRDRRRAHPSLQLPNVERWILLGAVAHDEMGVV